MKYVPISNGILFHLGLSLIGFVGVAEAQTEAEKLDKIFDVEWEYSMHEFPEFATSVGYPGQNHRWTDHSMEAIERRKEHEGGLLEVLGVIDPSMLGVEDRLNYDLSLREAWLAVEGHRFPHELQPITQMGGVQQDVAQTIARMPTKTVKDYENIIARTKGVGRLIDANIALLREGLRQGITPPKITLRDVAEQAMNQVVEDASESALWEPFKTFPKDISPSEQSRLKEAAERAIMTVAVPGFEKLHDYLSSTYVPGARESIAATELPDGKAWYAYRVKVMTTTDMTPREIHDLGLSEVKRIRSEMDRVIKDSGFKGGFEAFTEFLRTDPQFYFTDKESLLQAYRDIAKRIDPELIKLFGTLPRTPYGVKAIPSYAEKSQTTAYYMRGSSTAGMPGYFYANTYRLESRPSWEMEALTIHEAVPGHHLQISIAQELEGLPEFRKWTGPTAFVEGWGLYAESLGEEMGFYQDPYSKFGQLTYEMWRAVRLVVDTGMHAFGWSRQKAIDYFMANTSRQEHDVTVEIDRYIVWPGQALAYKIGELKFKELRAYAKKELGEDFDLRTFHDALLVNGALPLDVVDSLVRGWVGREKAKID